MAKIKKYLFGTVVALATYLLIVNSLEQTTLRYLPFVKPIRDVPVILVIGIAFGAGVLSTHLSRWWNSFRKKVKKEL
jgi:hypothetical protein